MKPQSYSFEIGTSNPQLSTNRLSRVYTLLNSNYKNGKTYGFEYIFFKQMFVQIQNTDLFERGSDHTSILIDLIASNISSVNIADIKYIIESEQFNERLIDLAKIKVVTDTDIIGIVQEFINAENLDPIGMMIGDIEADTNDIYVDIIDTEIATNDESIIDIQTMPTAYGNIFTDTEIQELLISDRFESISYIYDKIEMASSKNHYSKCIDIFKLAYSKRTKINSYMLPIFMDSIKDKGKFILNSNNITAYGSNKSFIVEDDIIIGSSDNKVIEVLNNKLLASGDYGEFVEQNTPIVAFKNNKEYTHLQTKSAKSQYRSNVTINLRSKDFVRNISNIISKLDVVYSEKYTSKVLDLSNMWSIDKNISKIVYNHTVHNFNKSSKDNTLFVYSDMRFVKTNLDGLMITNTEYEVLHKIIDIIDDMLFAPMITRFGETCKLKESSRGDGKRSFYENSTIFAHINDRFGNILKGIMSMQKIYGSAETIQYDVTFIRDIPYRMMFHNQDNVLASSNNKTSVIHIHKQADSSSVPIEIFRKSVEESTAIRKTIKADEVIFFEIAEDSSTDILIEDIMNTAIKLNKESVLLVGLKCYKRESVSDMFITKIKMLDKYSRDTVRNLLAIGWNKAPHDNEFIHLIDSKDDNANNAIIQLVSDALRDSRNESNVSIQTMVDRIQHSHESIEHSLLTIIDVDKLRKAYTLESNTGSRRDVHSGIIPDNTEFERVKDNNGNIEEVIQSEWDTEWNQLTNIINTSKDKYDRLKVPNDDYDYSKLKDTVFNSTTGVPFYPIGPSNKEEVEIQYPLQHFNTEYSNLIRENIPVDLYVYKDVMLLIWIFWCKHRGTEQTALILKEVYNAENIEMTRIQEFSKIIEMDAAKALNYILDNIYKWIQNTIAYYDHEKMSQYERVMKQVRWFGEKISNELSKYILVREYDSFILDMQKYNTPLQTDNVISEDGTLYNSSATEDGRVYLTDYNKTIDGEMIIELMNNNGMLKVLIDDEEKLLVTDNGLYLENNPTNLSIIQPGLKVDIPMGNHSIKIIMSGNIKAVKILNIKITNQVFKNATTRHEAESKTGNRAIDKLLQMMYDYYEIHHENKAKGERNLWNQD